MEMSLDKNIRFESIQMLRAIAALLVVTEHIGFLHSGAFGVDIFFVISGFMIMYSTREDMKHFLVKRFFRILPLYWGLTLAVFGALLIAPGIFENTAADWRNLVKSLFFIPYMQNGVMQPVVRIGWTVNYEMFFYLIFWAAGRLSHKFRGVITAGVSAGLVFGCGMIPYKPDVFSFYCNPVILEFAFGILCYYIVCALYTRRYDTRMNKWCFVLAGICLFALVYTRNMVKLEVLGRLLHWGIPAAVIFLLFLFGGKDAVCPKLLVKIGDMSFSIYLIHYYVIRLAGKLCDMNVCSVKSLLVSGAGLAGVLAMSYISWYFIENKFTIFLKSVMIKKV